MFPKVPQSSLGILRVPQLPPPWTPPLRNPTNQPCKVIIFGNRNTTVQDLYTMEGKFMCCKRETNHFCSLPAVSEATTVNMSICHLSHSQRRKRMLPQATQELRTKNKDSNITSHGNLRYPPPRPPPLKQNYCSNKALLRTLWIF